MSHFRIGDWQIDPSLNQIVRESRVVHVEPRSMEVLVFLADRPGRVLSKREIIDGVWGDAFVTDEVLTHAVWELRRAFEDDARNPTYIQTISKKGYRLLAPVTRGPVEADGSEPALRREWIPAAVLLVIGAVVGLQPRLPAAREAPVTTVPDHSQCLVLDAPEGGYGELQRQFDPKRLETRLSILPQLEVVFDPADCGRRDPRDHHLEVALPGAGKSTIELALRSLASGRTTYSFQLSGNVGAGADPTDALIDEVRRFATVNAVPQAHDPHINFWFDWSRHDLEAIAAFLEGTLSTLRFESRPGDAYRRAIELDESFVAPRVWITPRLLAADLEEREAHVAALEALQGTRGPFENTMIDWAIALCRGDWSRALAALDTAHGLVPDNGPILIVLAAMKANLKQQDQSLSILQPLIDDGWPYPALYPQAASYAIDLHQIKRARGILDHGLAVASPPSLDLLALLESLAAWQGQEGEADAFRGRLLGRMEEVGSEDRRLNVDESVKMLSQRARQEGRDAVADRLEGLLDLFT